MIQESGRVKICNIIVIYKEINSGGIYHWKLFLILAKMHALKRQVLLVERPSSLSQPFGLSVYPSRVPSTFLQPAVSPWKAGLRRGFWFFLSSGFGWVQPVESPMQRQGEGCGNWLHHPASVCMAWLRAENLSGDPLHTLLCPRLWKPQLPSSPGLTVALQPDFHHTVSYSFFIFWSHIFGSDLIFWLNNAFKCVSLN